MLVCGGSRCSDGEISRAQLNQMSPQQNNIVVGEDRVYAGLSGLNAESAIFSIIF